MNKHTSNEHMAASKQVANLIHHSFSTKGQLKNDIRNSANSSNMGPQAPNMYYIENSGMTKERTTGSLVKQLPDQGRAEWLCIKSCVKQTDC